MSESIWAWIWDSLLVVSLLMIAILAIRRPVAKMFGPAVAYWLWLLPAARLLMPSLQREVSMPTAPAVANDGAAATAVNFAEIAAGNAEMTAATLSAGSSIDWMQLAVIIWLAGAAFLFIAQNLRYVSMRDALLADAAYLGRAGGVQLIESDQVAGPLAFGLFKRYIVVPENFTTLFSAEERELALAHEMAHHKSGDLFANLAAFSVLCLTWFNPLSWLAWNAFRFDQEAACDARVLEGRDAKTKEIYGRTLARVAHVKLPQARIADDRLPVFATALNSPKTIIARLRNLNMRDISKNRRLFGKLGIIAAVGITLPLTATVVTVPVAARGKAVVLTSDQRGPSDKNGALQTEIYINAAGKSLPENKETPFVRTLEIDGKLIVLRSNKALTDAEATALVEEAEASRKHADAALVEADAARKEAGEAQGAAEAAIKEADKAIKLISKHGPNHSVQVIHNGKGRVNFSWSESSDDNGARATAWSHGPAASLSDIRHGAVKGVCTKKSWTSASRIEDARGKTEVRTEICGDAMQAVAEKAALKGLRGARDKIRRERSLQLEVRRNALAHLDREIARLQNGPAMPAAPRPPEPTEPVVAPVAPEPPALPAADSW